MNKALEQKLLGPLEESHTKEQSPRTVLWMELWARRSKMAARWARTHVWAMVGFFLEEDEVSGCWNKWRGSTWGPRGRRARPRGWAPCALVDKWWAPLVCSQCQKFLNILQKSYFIFRTFGELLFSGYFYCKDNSENRQKIVFLLYLI
mgnify:CR=1 FL=1